MVPFFNTNKNVTLFQKNIRCHTALVSMRYLDEQLVRILPWPAFSTYLSPLNICGIFLILTLDIMILIIFTSWRSFYVKSERRSFYMKSRTLFGPCADAAPLSLTQTEGTHSIERFVTFWNDPYVISDINLLNLFWKCWLFLLSLVAKNMGFLKCNRHLK